jgi:hypothetical protein
MSRMYSLAVPYPPASTCSSTHRFKSGGSDTFIVVRMAGILAGASLLQFVSQNGAEAQRMISDVDRPPD